MNFAIKLDRNIFIASFCIGAAACAIGNGDGQDTLESIGPHQLTGQVPAGVGEDASQCIECRCNLDMATVACRATWPGTVAQATKGNTCKSADCLVAGTVGCGGTIKCFNQLGVLKGELPGGNNGVCEEVPADVHEEPVEEEIEPAECRCDVTAATLACRATWPGTVAQATKGNTCKSADCLVAGTVGCGGTIKCFNQIGVLKGELPGGNNGLCQ